MKQSHARQVVHEKHHDFPATAARALSITMRAHSALGQGGHFCWLNPKNSPLVYQVIIPFPSPNLKDPHLGPKYVETLLKHSF